jgi:TolA-binding protein
MDRARLTEALQAQLGEAVVLGGAGTVAAKSVVGAAWIKVCAATAGLGLLAGGAALVSQPKTEPQVVPPARVAPARSPAAAPVVAESAPIAAPETVVRSPKEPAPAAPALRRPADRLAQEVALLSRATTALRSGRPEEALKALAEHQRQFPKGVLTEERRAARAQALCTLGRHGEARADLSTLAKTAPQSPQAARARQACGKP